MKRGSGAIGYLLEKGGLETIGSAAGTSTSTSTSGGGGGGASVVVHIARGAPRRWYQTPGEPFGLVDGPTRVGNVSYSISLLNATAVGGTISLTPNPGQVLPAALSAAVLFAVKVRAPKPEGLALARVQVLKGGATVVAMHAQNETVVFAPTAGSSSGGGASFAFAAGFE